MKTLIKEFKEKIRNIKLKEIISIDETSVDTNMTPIYGWGKKGKKIIIKNAIPKKRYTLICAINKNKVIG